MSYTYDAIGRVSSRVAECGADAGKLTSSYSYVDGGFGTNSTTPLVKKITQNGISFEYEYDSRGNIVSEKRGNLTTTYAYDALGQLIRVNDPHENATWVYSYDCGGNILSKTKYAYTTGTVGTALESIPYSYGDANWKDKLTAYNGTAITYDAIGNPLNDGAWTFTWTAGRQLKKMVREDRTLDFKYDHNGMRIQKVLQHDWYPETTNYTYHDKLLTHMEVEYYDFDEVKHTDKLHFFYDAQSRPVKISYNGVIYTYVHNLQGDIVGILDSTGALVVEYKYDAWGKLLSTTGSLTDTLGDRNPFRYRGYVYDEESALYYLKSRYYNPVFGRFVNADDEFVVEIERFHHNQYNLFAYCNNDPVFDSDTDGMLSLFGKIALGIGAAICVAAVTVLTCGVGTATLAGAVAVGAAKGALIGAAAGAAAGAGIGYATTGTVDGMWEGAAIGFGVGSAVGMTIGGTYSGVKYGSFASKKLLTEHYAKHGQEFGKMYSNVRDYAKGAKYVVKNGTYIPEKNAYIRFLGTEGKANYAFVGMKAGGRVSTYHVRTVSKLVRDGVRLFVK